MAWTDEDLRTAKLVHGPEQNKSDTYRLIKENPDGSEKWLDVPGWMVGDAKNAALRMRAAQVITVRLLEEHEVGRRSSATPAQHG